jgi:hypothetical protein
MLGLPGETMDDVFAIADLVEKVLAVGGKRLSVNVTLSSFIPKVFTPFQWDEQDSPKLIQRKIDTIKPLLRNMKRVKVMSRDPRYSQLEGVMSRGDRRLGQVIYKTWQQGAKFDSWREFYNFDLWDDIMRECELNVMEYTGSRDLNADLPWEIIDSRVSKKFFLSERVKSKTAITSRDCRDGCIGCDVCYDDLQMDIVEQEEGKSFTFAKITEQQEKNIDID